MKKADKHGFKGLARTGHPIRQNAEYLWDAHNIRLTTREDDTLLSITNERSTRSVWAGFSETARYVGHIQCGKYLIVFICDGDEDVIYRLDLDDLDGEAGNKSILYKAAHSELNFSIEHPIQAVFVCETSLVNKVYWTDNYNPVRYMDITRPDRLGTRYDTIYGYSEAYLNSSVKGCPFDTVPSLNWGIVGTREVSVEIQYGYGEFPAGVIQYAFTYSHKYCGETPIIYTTPLYPIGFAERGGSPEEKIAVSFYLKGKKMLTGFDYVNIYSIIRTTRDAEPTVKRVAQINGKDFNTAGFRDSGFYGETIDANELLFSNKRKITAGCIEVKDNTLFLGDITYTNKALTNITSYKDIREAGTWATGSEAINTVKRMEEGNLCIADAMIPEFMYNQWYRLGIRFQYDTGEWSEPVFLKDWQCTTWEIVNQDFADKNLSVKYGRPVWRMNDDMKKAFTNANIVNIEPLIAIPQSDSWNIIANCIATPTVYNAYNRHYRTGIWSQSSWLSRPLSFLSLNKPESYTGYDFATMAQEEWGSVATSKHGYGLPTGLGTDVEIQSLGGIQFNDSSNDDTAAIEGVNRQGSVIDISKLADSYWDKKKGLERYNDMYGIDWSIMDLYSLDFLDSEMLNYFKSMPTAEFHFDRYFGFYKNRSKMDIQTSTSFVYSGAKGFTPIEYDMNGDRSLISSYAFNDYPLTDKGGDSFDKNNADYTWLSYMWHRNDSLTNGVKVGEITANELKFKKLCNYRESQNIYKGEELIYTPDDYYSYLFSNTTQVELEKVRDCTGVDEKGEEVIEDVSYYHNVDTIIAPNHDYYNVIKDIGEHNEYDYRWSTVVIDPVFTCSGLYAVKSNKLELIADSATMTVLAFNITWSWINGYVATLTFTDKDGKEVNITANKRYIVFNCYKNDYYPQKFTDRYPLEDVTYFSSPKENAVMSITFTQDVDGYKKGDMLYAIVQYPEKALYVETNPALGYALTEHVITKNRWVFGYPITKLYSSIAVAEFPNKSFPYGMSNEAVAKLTSGIRMKYKTSPHLVVSTKTPFPCKLPSGYEGADKGYGFLPMFQVNSGTIPDFGGDSDARIKQILWIPAGKVQSINEYYFFWNWGDCWTHYFELLKTYPYSFDDYNQVTEILSFPLQSRINYVGRYDRNRYTPSVSVSPENHNMINYVYSQLNTFFNSQLLDEDYYKNQNYPSQIMWTSAKVAGATIDNWVNSFHMASSTDADGSRGRVIDIKTLGQELLMLQENRLSQILFNERVQIDTSDNNPIEITNGYKVSGFRTIADNVGCQNKWSAISSTKKLYFIDDSTNTFYAYSQEGLEDLNFSLGNYYWLKEEGNYPRSSWTFYSEPNPYKSKNNGYRTFYDPMFKDIYFTPGLDVPDDGQTLMQYSRYSMCYSELLGAFTSQMSYGGSVMSFYNGHLYALAHDIGQTNKLKLYKCFEGVMPEDVNTKSYNHIFGMQRPYDFTFISNADPELSKIFDTVEFKADNFIADKYDNLKVVQGEQDDYMYYTRRDTTNTFSKPFDYVRVSNEYQDSEATALNDSSLRKKFRIWRLTLPRAEGRNENGRKRARLVNPWVKITLGKYSPHHEKLVLNDLTTYYTV